MDTYCDGLCASIAAIILLSGKKVYMNDFAKIMVHKAYVPGMNDTNLTEKQKQALAEINDTTTQIINKRTGLSAEEVTTILEKDTYFNAQDAKAKGFVDEIIATPQKNKVVEASQNLNIYDPEFLYALYQSVLPLPEKKTPTPPKKQPTQNMEQKKEENALIAMLMESLEVAEEKDILQKINLLKASKMKADLLENELLTIKEQNQKMANQIAEQANQQAEILVEDAVKAGKIRPMQKESFIKMAKHDYQMAKETIDSMNGHPNLAQKVKQEDERANWSLKDWAKKDSEGLKYIRENNWEQYSELYKKEYGDNPVQISSNIK